MPHKLSKKMSQASLDTGFGVMILRSTSNSLEIIKHPEVVPEVVYAVRPRSPPLNPDKIVAGAEPTEDFPFKLSVFGIIVKDKKGIYYAPQKFTYVGVGADADHREKITEEMKEHIKKAPRGSKTYPFEMVGAFHHGVEVVGGIDDGYKSITYSTASSKKRARHP